MLKYAALLFNTVALLICQFFFMEDIKITQNMPSSAAPESEFTVEISINKGSMGGFAKLQQYIPQGLTVTPIEMKGGDFKFVNQQVKIIWMSLPSDAEFKISYKVKVDAGTGGDKKIGGKFSYVIDNVKQEIDIPESTVSIKSGTEAPVAATETKPETAAEPTPVATETPAPTPTPLAEPEKEKPTETVAAAEPNPVSTPEPTPTPEVKKEEPQPASTTKTATQDAAGVACTREVPEKISFSTTNPTNEFVVKIKINKGNISGFAKLLETLPAGFNATAMESAGGTFSFAEQKVKYVWVSIPTQPEFMVSYKVTVPSGVTGNINVDGVFSYIENDETKKYTITTSTITIGDTGGTETVAANTNTTSTTSVTSTETPAEPIKTETTTTTSTETVTKNNTSTETSVPTSTTSTTTTAATETVVTTTPIPQSNVMYRVQICALHNAIPATSLANRYNISENVITEMADGFTKYTVGAHNEYKSARDARENIRLKGIVGPFVTAYNSGKRITVQEALMLTNQKWYK